MEVFKENINLPEYYEEPQLAGPPPPSINISLRGELSEIEADEIYKTIPGVDLEAADPLMRESLRKAMRGELPEHDSKEDRDISKRKAEMELNNMGKPKE